MKIFLICFLFPLLFVFPQGKENSRDTSFTLYSATLKVKKDYPSISPVDRKIPLNVEVKKNLVYSIIGKRRLHADLFTPKTKSKNPAAAVIIIHGGGWRSGDKSMEHHIAINLASNGFAAMTIEYQLSTEALYPAAVLNINSAIAWLKSNAEKFNINRDKIVLLGTSAGGHLAALAGVTSGIKKFEPVGINTNSKVAAIIDIDGVLDMTTPEESGKDTISSKPSAAKQWLGFTFKDRPEIWQEASPINYISKSTPPMLFINSSLPRFHAGRDSVISMMKKWNTYSEVHTLANTPHPFWLFHPWFDEAFGYIVRFLKNI